MNYFNDVSVIIVSYNSEEILENCINSIIKNTVNLDYSIYIVDNASTDNSCSLIKSKFPHVNLIENKINVGFGSANNQVLKIVNSKYVFLLNPDTQLLNNAIKILFDFMEINEKIACSGANLYKEDLSLQYAYGNFPSIKKVFFEFGLNKIFKNYFDNNLAEAVLFKNNKFAEVPYITGADIMIRKNVLAEIGFFDEDFFLYYEETELQYRIRKSGYQIFLNPQAKIIHLSNISINKMPVYQKVKTVETSRLLYYKKVYGAKTALLITVLYLIKYLFLFIIKRKNISSKHIKVMLELLKNS